MIDQQRKETDRQFKLRQFRQVEQETTDPLARRLISDIISDLEAEKRSDEKPLQRFQP